MFFLTKSLKILIIFKCLLDSYKFVVRKNHKLLLAVFFYDLRMNAHEGINDMTLFYGEYGIQ